MVQLEYTYKTILTSIYQPLLCQNNAQLQLVATIEFSNMRYSELMVYVFQP